LTRLRALAPGKVNLCLFLGDVREDARHELVTLFESVSLADELLLSSAPRDAVVCREVPGPNLVATALARLRELGWEGPPIRVEIEKSIPVAAGMGGGSADAAAMLRLAGELSPIDPGAIAVLAAELGADVPSQLSPGLSLGTGAGEVVEPRSPLPAHALAIVPSVHALATADVYREADRLGLARPRAELDSLRRDLDAVLGSGSVPPERLLVNDLAPAALSLCPSIADGLEATAAAAADQVLVCGSGPTVAGLFWGPEAVRRTRDAVSTLQSRFPGAVCVEPVPADHGNPRIA
jgi:4-diphosphocytidyl-2-C-methyl-D-erythritol kinase